MAKIEMTDCTFCIPVFIDSQDRQENLEIAYNFLNDTFDTTILVGEMGRNSVVKNVPVSIFQPMHDWYFHKTKILNDLYKKATTPIVIRYDCDVIFNIENLIDARSRIINGATMCFPFDGKFYDFSRKFKQLFIDKDFNKLELGEVLHKNYEDKGTLVSTMSYGAACFYQKEDFKKCGYENEDLKSWGSEDTESWMRLNQLKKRIERTSGVAYHLSHSRGENSSEGNSFANRNAGITNHIGGMHKEELEEMIKRWCWCK